MVALQREVNRRWQAVSWFWRRRSHAEENKRWAEHGREAEIAAIKYTIDRLSKRDHFEDRLTIQKLEKRLSQLIRKQQ